MVEVKPENYFFVCNGEVLKDLQDLLGFLSKTDDEFFFYHVNDERNDFAIWVGEVLQEKALAKKIEEANNRDDMISAIQGKLKRRSSGKRSKGEIISQIKNAIVNG